jgi:hypothetical protein
LVKYSAPWPLAALVVVAGGGYLVDSAGTILIAGYGLSISTFTFIGEALLIFWLFWRTARDSRSPELAVDASNRASAPAGS